MGAQEPGGGVMRDQRKAELLESLLISVNGFLSSMNGSRMFGNRVKAYYAQNNKICIKAADGSVYYVAVQKSSWTWKEWDLNDPE